MLAMGLICKPRSILPLLIFLLTYTSGEVSLGKSPAKVFPPDSVGILKLSMPTSKSMTRADVYFWMPASTKQISAVIVLAPELNGNGKKLIDPSWREFASRQNVALSALSFASDKNATETSYSNARSGSGELLQDGITWIVGDTKASSIPILIYGFSAGARFTASFVESYPERRTCNPRIQQKVINLITIRDNDVILLFLLVQFLYQLYQL